MVNNGIEHLISLQLLVALHLAAKFHAHSSRRHNNIWKSNILFENCTFSKTFEEIQIIWNIDFHFLFKCLKSHLRLIIYSIFNDFVIKFHKFFIVYGIHQCNLQFLFPLIELI